MRSSLEEAYDAISAAIVDAARRRSAGTASAVAEAFGLVELGDGKPSQKHIWERCEGSRILRFQWRWYDQSKAFSIQPDMNILSVELLHGAEIIQRREERFED